MKFDNHLHMGEIKKSTYGTLSDSMPDIKWRGVTWEGARIRYTYLIRPGTLQRVDSKVSQPQALLHTETALEIEALGSGTVVPATPASSATGMPISYADLHM